MDHRVEVIQRGIEERQRELHNIAEILALAASRKGRLGALAKVTTIALGALIATQAVAVQILGDNSVGVIVAYSFAGLLVATIGGLEAAFRNEARAAELYVLAAQCQSTIWQIDSEWSKSVGTATGEAQFQAARALLDRQDSTLTEIQSRAAQAGVNITLAVRRLYGGEIPALA
jgi:hypothetical protein